MAKKHSLTKRRRRPKSDRRKDYTAETMSALKSLHALGIALLEAELKAHDSITMTNIEVPK